MELAEICTTLPFTTYSTLESPRMRSCRVASPAPVNVPTGNPLSIISNVLPSIRIPKSRLFQLFTTAMLDVKPTALCATVCAAFHSIPFANDLVEQIPSFVVAPLHHWPVAHNATHWLFSSKCTWSSSIPLEAHNWFFHAKRRVRTQAGACPCCKGWAPVDNLIQEDMVLATVLHGSTPPICTREWRPLPMWRWPTWKTPEDNERNVFNGDDWSPWWNAEHWLLSFTLHVSIWATAFSEPSPAKRSRRLSYNVDTCGKDNAASYKATERKYPW